MVEAPRVEDVQSYAQNIVDTVREPLLILDATLRVQSANRAFYRTFHVSAGETEGQLIYELGNGQWDTADLRMLLEDIVPQSSIFENFELHHTFPVIGRRVMLLNARKLQAGSHGELLVLAMEDITARKDADEILLKAVAVQQDLQMQLEKTNAQLAHVNDRMSRDLQAAARIQAAFLPRDLPQVPGVEFAWIYQPCDELAGDGLNIIPLGNGRVGLYVLDVSGHGVVSALLSVSMSRLLSPPSDPASILIRGGNGGDRLDVIPPAEVAARLNRLFSFDPATAQFATLIYGILDVETGDFVYISAGHPGPVHLPSRGDLATLPSGGLPIGLGDDVYLERSVHLQSGDRLYLYSDGVPEAMNAAGELLGNTRMLRELRQGRSKSHQEGLASLLQSVIDWLGTAKAQDDLSILAIEISSSPAAKRIPSG